LRLDRVPVILQQEHLLMHLPTRGRALSRQKVPEWGAQGGLCVAKSDSCFPADDVLWRDVVMPGSVICVCFASLFLSMHALLMLASAVHAL
jgi:hypothetical protein